MKKVMSMSNELRQHVVNAIYEKVRVNKLNIMIIVNVIGNE